MPTGSPAVSPTPRETSALPGPHETIARGVTHCITDGIPLQADIYFAQDGFGKAPLLIFIHGGGMGFEGIPLPSPLRATPWPPIDYRLAPEYRMPAMIEDVKCAVRFFRAQAAEYAIDPDRIGVVGASAGGHLAAMLGTADESAGFDVGE